jgi:alkaline phosphatase D
MKLCIAAGLALLGTTCDSGPPATQPPTPDANAPGVPDARPPGDALACVVGQTCACTGDADCGGGFCECADETCSQRICSAVPCQCSYGASCGAPLADGTADPNFCQGEAACYGGACLTPAPAPPPPPIDDVVKVVTVSVRTGAQITSSTGDPVTLCLSSTDCFPLSRTEAPEMQQGKVDTFQFELGAGISRARLDRVELRIASADGGTINEWEPACVSVQYDGASAYCRQPVPVVLGDAATAQLSWIDPDGLQRMDCTTCNAETLTHGPMIGALDPDRARVWVRVDSSRRVGLRLSGGPALDSAPVVAWAYPSAASDFMATLEVAGLSPDTTYFYGIEIDGVLREDPRWYFTTPPPRGQTGELTFAFGSCARQEHPQDIFTPIAQARPDLFLFLGDNNYGDATQLDSHRWHELHLRESARGLLLASVPTMGIWDDHDFLGNDSDGTGPGRDMARRSFTELWANPVYGEGGQGIYYRHSYGAVDFFMLDGRSFRDPIDGTVAYGDPEGRPSLLGPQQTTWLIDELRASTAPFKVLALGSQWTTNGNDDSWASFLEARDAIFDAIAMYGIEGVILLSGDRHRSEFRLLPRPGAYDLPELTSSPMANTVRECDPEHDDLVACEGLNVATNESYYQVSFATVDTTAADPTFTATIYRHKDGALEPAHTWVIQRSSLDFE